MLRRNNKNGKTYPLHTNNLLNNSLALSDKYEIEEITKIRPIKNNKKYVKLEDRNEFKKAESILSEQTSDRNPIESIYVGSTNGRTTTLSHKSLELDFDGSVSTTSCYSCAQLKPSSYFKSQKANLAYNLKKQLKKEKQLFNKTNLEQNEAIYALIFKEKTNSDMHENDIVNLIKNGHIETKNQSVPYEIESTKAKIALKSNQHSSVQPVILNNSAVSNQNNYNFLENRKKYLPKFHTPASYKIMYSDYRFKNLRELQAKYPNVKEKINLSSTPAALSSSQIFKTIYNFDIADKYKQESKNISDDVKAAISRTTSFKLVNKNTNSKETLTSSSIFKTDTSGRHKIELPLVKFKSKFLLNPI